mmetsp:Transcript_39351/g.76424  ORF Transcript_39351/g.76424 Transcript_39351/m.76424 type:complete len:248 (-) Transcript_39351:233-976(-)
MADGTSRSEENVFSLSRSPSTCRGGVVKSVKGMASSERQPLTNSLKVLMVSLGRKRASSIKRPGKRRRINVVSNSLKDLLLCWRSPRTPLTSVAKSPAPTSNSASVASAPVFPPLPLLASCDPACVFAARLANPIIFTFRDGANFALVDSLDSSDAFDGFCNGLVAVAGFVFSSVRSGVDSACCPAGFSLNSWSRRRPIISCAVFSSTFGGVYLNVSLNRRDEDPVVLKSFSVVFASDSFVSTFVFP